MEVMGNHEDGGHHWGEGASWREGASGESGGGKEVSRRQQKQLHCDPLSSPSSAEEQFHLSPSVYLVVAPNLYKNACVEVNTLRFHRNLSTSKRNSIGPKKNSCNIK